jgi:thiamine-phosphate pyrophosphorylase
MKCYAIADLNILPPAALLNRIRRLADLGVEYVQLRDKEDRGRLERTAREVRTLIDTSEQTELIVNGELDIARQIGADGIHLPANGPSVAMVRERFDGLVGRSCHSLDNCRRAAAEGANYLLLGPLFPPRSKPGMSGVTLEDLETASRLGMPVFALGGISADNLSELQATGIEGIAAITLFMADEPIDSIVRTIKSS